jgi:hypothetical protein
LDVATGNWDSYAWNKNNYILYHDSTLGKFRYITFDTDNTFGVDWSGINWTTRNPYLWQHDTEPRVLTQRLMTITASKQLFATYLDSITQYVTNPSKIFSRIDSLKNLLAPYVAADSFRTLDYGYTVPDFHDGFVSTVDNHTPWGIKPFLLARYFNSLTTLETNIKINNLSIQPTKGTHYFKLISGSPNYIKIYNINGHLVHTLAIQSGEYIINCSHWQSGVYIAKANTGEVIKLIKE